MIYSISQPLPNVLHIAFDSTHNMSASLGRVQEYAEGPKLHHQIVSWSRLKKYHMSKGNTRTFNDAWLGFNIPGWSFKEFYEKCNTFKPKERELLEKVLSYNFEGEFYVIADADGSAKRESYKAGEHEFAHALWGTNKEYKKEIKEVLDSFSMRDTFLLTIKKMNCYAPEVWEDELHAYLTTDSLSTVTDRFNIKTVSDELKQVKESLDRIFKKYYGEGSNVKEIPAPPI